MAPCGGHGSRPGRLGSYRDRRGAHGALRPRVARPPGDRSAAALAPFSPRSRHRARQRVADGSSASPGAGGSPCGSPTAPERDAPDRLVPTHVYEREPEPRSSPGVGAPGSPLFTNSRPASEDRTPERAADPLAPPSPHRVKPRPLARTTLSRRGLARRHGDRVTDRPREGEPRRLPFGQEPSPHDALSDVRLGPSTRGRGGACHHTASLATPFRPSAALSSCLRAGSPCTRPLPAGSRF